MKKKMVYFTSLFFLSFLFFQNKVLAYSNYTNEGKLSCGNGMIANIPPIMPQVISIIYITLQIAVPVLIVIFGSIDLIKAISAGKEDDMKKAQNTFLRRLALGALVFFLFIIVKLLVYSVGNHQDSVVNCMKCFLSNKCAGK